MMISTLALSRKDSFLDFYQIVLAIIAILLFFTNLDLYLYIAGIIPYPPTILIFGYALFSLPVVFSKYSSLPRYFIFWAIAFISISSLSLLIFDNSRVSYPIAFQEFRLRILSTIFLGLMIVVFSKDGVIQKWVKKAILLAVILAVFNNIYDFFHPFVFCSCNLGRPAGLYINPNQSGYSLVLGMIFSIGVVKPKYRFYFWLFVGIGLILTLSRSAIIGYLFVTLLLAKEKKLVIYWKSTLVLISLLLITYLIFYLGNLGSNGIKLTEVGNINSFYDYSISVRMEWLNNPFLLDESDSLRSRVIELGWIMFLQHPLFGNGLGSTLDWQEIVSTHNMYLYYMVDHGIIGIFIFPILIWVVTKHARGEARFIGLLFTTLMLFLGLFSHNLLTERYVLIGFALMSAMNSNSHRTISKHLYR
ncbi:O-antigen ligase family protein [Oscillatoria sp. FACHB-1406]|uniref:O-antigen ligase family protein n=1 Tax=Oscillatoria sp. FACHB-1406 TaxID=2692846 RepID=UPI001689D439|nr:O-antigen ligase family protein [Oscillatoria sp. FACHB-1406]MBD2577197.1 O-antigen ligase family protein [Oscillatoria sp. FACHB-1406]